MSVLRKGVGGGGDQCLAKRNSLACARGGHRNREFVLGIGDDLSVIVSDMAISQHVALTPSNAFVAREILTAMSIESGLSRIHIVVLDPKSPCAAPAGVHDNSFRRSNRA
jgi:hypothetical protein